MAMHVLNRRGNTLEAFYKSQKKSFTALKYGSRLAVIMIITLYEIIMYPKSQNNVVH